MFLFQPPAAQRRRTTQRHGENKKQHQAPQFDDTTIRIASATYRQTKKMLFDNTLSLAVFVGVCSFLGVCLLYIIIGCMPEGVSNDTVPATTLEITEVNSIVKSRKELLRQNLYVRQIKRVESVKELLQLLDVMRNRLFIMDNEKIGGLSMEIPPNTPHLDDHRDGCGKTGIAIEHDPECSICLNQYLPSDVVAWAKDVVDASSSKYDGNLSPKSCGHIFHKECLVAWLQEHDECPLCRRKVVHVNAKV